MFSKINIYVTENVDFTEYWFYRAFLYTFPGKDITGALTKPNQVENTPPDPTETPFHNTG